MSKIEIAVPASVETAASSTPTSSPADPKDGARALSESFAGLSPPQRIARLRQMIPGKITLTTGFGLEGQVILHWIAEGGHDIDVVTLDTGRLFPETYELWAETERRYGRTIRAIYPQNAGLEELITQQGINGFYQSRETRTACCDVRKVEPLNRALDGAQAWITGLRGDQSAHRSELSIVTLDWTREAVADFAAANGVPINPLHARGFVSIGCAPCTRAISPGEPERAGRWWWEMEGKKECGLHLPRA
jgi:phosphoadenosine phosphosulfate reductase